MERRTKKMLLAILMILSVLATDFFVLGSGIMTYASQFNSETNNPNVEFSVYFKENDNRIDSIEKSIKAEEVKVYAEIKVKNEGYLKEGTVIELENSNFDLKNNILSSNKHINSIEGNKVVLKQIGAGETVEIELEIEPAITDKITADYLSKTSTVKMIGSYVYSKAEEGQTIRTDKVVSINYTPDELIGAELETDVITNKIMGSNGENKRIVQLLIKSGITNNEYPVKETKLTATIPQLGEEIPEISAIAINKLATNGKTEINNFITENGLVEITLNNETSWMKNACDEIVITYIYPETVDASKIEITTNSEITLYDSNETVLKAESKELSENEELNNTIIGRIENTTKELYKGKLYANLDLTYNTETKIAITNSNIVENVVVQEGEDVFGVSEKELLAETKYVTTEINVREMLEILGQDGSIEIKNGETSYVINKETEIDENGNAKINYKNAASKLEIKTSNPEKAGIIKLKHTKTMTGKGYTREQLQEVQNLKTKLSIEGIAKTAELGVLELKETKSKAELTIENNKTSLSTTEANDVILGITLITNGEQYDLYKNPKISLKFPSAVENVELMSEAIKQNADAFTVNVGVFNKTNKTMLVDLQGEQTIYPDSELTQEYIQLNLKIELNSLAIAQTDKIMMAYTNENASQYENEINGVGVAQQAVQISAPSQLIKGFNLSTNENTSYTETITQRVKESQAGKTLDFEISLINNKDSNISNMRILGKLPTTGNTISRQDANTLETTLKGITADDATIYYTENAEATIELEETANGWTQDLSTLANAKMYLMKVENLERGDNFTAKATMQIPSSITENTISYTQYGVIYDTETEKNIAESSRKIGLSSIVADITTELTAKVGQETIENGDTVKEWEVIRYIATVKNNGTQTLQNVQLKAEVPEGTVLVKPFRNLEYGIDGTIVPDAYVYMQGYYEQITDNKKIEEATSTIISELKPGELAKIEYEVGVKDGASGKQVSNKVTAIHDDSKMTSEELKNIITEGNIMVTVKRAISEETQFVTGRLMEYVVYVQNVSDSAINNLELEILSNELNVQKVELNDEILYSGDVPNKILINELKEKNEGNSTNYNEGLLTFRLYGSVGNETRQMKLSATVKDSTGNTYRGNNITEDVNYADAIISITSPQDGLGIKEGDTVEYNIIIKNIGDVKGSMIINSNTLDFLQIQDIFVEGQKVSKSTSLGSHIYHIIELDAGESANLDVIAKVDYIPKYYNGKVITNNIDISFEEILIKQSKSISHILQSNKVQDDVKNVISGFVWYDLNGNGKKDSTEQAFSEIKVKLYDVSTQDYVVNENGVLIWDITNQEGQYSFSNIKNGSYLIVFEYDTEKYEPTKPFADGVNTDMNSKAILKYIRLNDETPVVASIKIDDLDDNLFYMNLGFKENTGDMIPEELPKDPDIPEIPEEPEMPEEPENPEQPEIPENSGGEQKPEQPENTEKPGQTEKQEPETPESPNEEEKPVETKTISGYAWLDSDMNGQKNNGETYLSGIKVRLYDVSTNNYILDENGNIIEVITDNNGKYQFTNIKKGSYIVIFEYNTEKYEIATQNSKVIVKKVKINGEEITVAVTDIIKVQNNVTNISVGLKEMLKFDLELNKYISKIVAQTSNETKTYNYEGKTLGKVEIHRKQIQGANIVLEYTINVKNTGEVPGYAKNIIDYLPSGLTFSSELNRDWYMSGNYLYTKSLENVEIKPGEEKEVKLILTKTMTNENLGLINNRAEIYQDYNKYGEQDIDSTPNNQAQNEDDFGTTDVIVQVATGGSIIAYILLAIINIILIYVAIRIMIQNGILHTKTKEERR